MLLFAFDVKASLHRLKRGNQNWRALSPVLVGGFTLMLLLLLIKLIEAGKPLPERFRFLLFEDKREVELVWSGKSDAVCNIVLPFQTIEQVDEPRIEKPSGATQQADMFSMDARGRQIKGWSNKLIWGDNKLILSSLKNGAMREAIENTGGGKTDIH